MGSDRKGLSRCRIFSRLEQPELIKDVQKSWFSMLSRALFRGLIFALSLADLKAADITTLVQKTKPAVVEIMTFDSQNKPLKTGTGFFVSSDGALLTNFHVISGASSILAKTPTGAVYFLKNVVAASESEM